MKPYGMVISVNYADYLELTLPENVDLFEKLLVVTDEKDAQTLLVCEKYKHKNVECVKTDAFYIHGAPFFKSVGFNAGLKYLNAPDWIITWDADIVIDKRFANIDYSKLNKNFVYGPQHKYHVAYDEMGSNLHDSGKACAGFCQLFNAKFFEGKNYYSPMTSGDCSTDDILFSKQFEKVEYFDMVAYHLGPIQESGVPNWNWKGRISPGCKLTNEEISQAMRKYSGV